MSVVHHMLGEAVEVGEAGWLLSPLEVVDRTAPGRQEELHSPATPVTMIWLVRDTLFLPVVSPPT